QQALDAEADHPSAHALLLHLHEVVGTRAARRGDFAEAAAHWEVALDGSAGAVRRRLLQNLALAEERLEHRSGASRHWQSLAQVWKKEVRDLAATSPAAAQIRRQLAAVYRHMAGTFESAGDLSAAARSLESALNFDPGQVELQLRAAELYLENEEFGKA